MSIRSYLFKRINLARQANNVILDSLPKLPSILTNPEDNNPNNSASKFDPFVITFKVDKDNSQKNRRSTFKMYSILLGISFISGVIYETAFISTGSLDHIKMSEAKRRIIDNERLNAAFERLEKYKKEYQIENHQSNE